MTSDYEEFLRLALGAFIAHPQKLEIEVRTGDRVDVTFRVHKTDQSLTIGKQSAMILAIRRILKSMANRNGRDLWLTLLEPATGTKEHEAPFEETKWGEIEEEKLRSIVEKLIFMVYGEGEVKSTTQDGMSLLTITIKGAVSLAEQAAWTVLLRSVGKGLGRGTVLATFKF